MLRIHQLLFVMSFLATNWIAMMAVHELGHVVGAVLTGGTVERVVIHPLAISRTDVSPNPNPFLVVWLGPVLGCVIPILVWSLVPRRRLIARRIFLFFAGFCLVANGAYIAFGAFDHVGDAGVMLQVGSPSWLLLSFGVITIPLGFFAWHSLGSLKQFLADPSLVGPKLAYISCVVFVLLLVVGFAISPM